MRPFCLICFLLLATSLLMAGNHIVTRQVEIEREKTDSLLMHINRRVEWFKQEGIGKLDLYADIYAQSYSEGQSWWTPLAHDILPFNYRQDDTTFLHATCKASYQTPCDLQLSPLSLTSDNRRRSRRILRELNQVFIPVYSLKLMRDKSDDKGYILPFTNDGMRRYLYFITDTIVQAHDTLVTITFQPKIPHHELLTGQADVSTKNYAIQEIRVQGYIDFGQFSDTLRFGLVNGYNLPQSSSVRIDYKYGKMRGHNLYDYDFHVNLFLPKKAFDPRLEPLDLSDVYQNHTPEFYLVPSSTTEKNDSANHHVKRHRAFLQKLPQRMVTVSNIDAFEGTDLRIYGPLNPAFIGYDKINGITMRERLTFTKLYDNDKRLRIMPEVGYAFRLKEFRYRLDTEWTYSPAHRGSLLLRLQNGSNGFSSRFRHDVNRIIRKYREQIIADPDLARSNGLSFDSLGLRFFNRYEFTLDNGFELQPGLMFHLGATYSIRRPVKHGVHAIAEKVADVAIENRYLDMNPYLRLDWTPHQYYYMERNQKYILRSQWPTFSLEYGNGIKDFLKSRGNYTRIEFDAHQHIRIGNTRNLSWHFGSGAFVKQLEEYFVNYTYFSRSQYPQSWDRRANGGTFALLDEYWYSSSPSYAQGHIMYESPFLLLHHWRAISKYVIRERVYSSLLWAQSKNLYGELGYGIGNNYFNLSLFMGFMGEHPVEAGIKFSIEIDQHL